MPSLFSRFKGRDGSKTKSKKYGTDQLADQLPPKPQWDDAWTRKTVEPEEIQDLVHLCTAELKARALDLPFLLLPFRPTSDPSAVRTFVRHFFDGKDGGQLLRGEALFQELRMTEPMVISGVIKWCWSRIQGGVVGWDSYELFKVGEHDSNMARDSFKTFIPLSVETTSRKEIIFDFFDLLASIAAHGKTNGFGGRKLSRMAAWWAFEHKDTGNGFESGYKSWLSAADATSHLFFAYLRSMAPQPSRGGISLLPMSLQKLLQDTEYPPERPALMQSSTNRVSMIVDTVSPTPFALLRRANHFQYRDEDRALREWSEYEDPIQALTEECRRVLRAVSAANQSQAVSSSKHSTSLRDASWSRFEDIGFTSALEEEDEEDDSRLQSNRRQGMRSTANSGVTDLGRPTTPSWADFLSSGFVDDKANHPSNHLLPPDKVLPPIDTNRQRSSQSHRPRLESENLLEPGELASIVRFDLDDSFWWVWMSSLAPEETPERKAAFGRCAVIETIIRTGRFLVMEEVVKGAAADPEEGAYIAEKKGFFSWTRRGKISRRKSTAGKNALDRGEGGNLKSSSTMGFSKTSIGPDQQARIQAAAMQLQMQEKQRSLPAPQERRGRNDSDYMTEKTNSVLTLQPSIFNEASPAVKWANKYDKDAIREAYLLNSQAGRGNGGPPTNGHATPTTNGHDRPPELPPKSPSLRAQPSPPVVPASSSLAQRVETPEPLPPRLADKALEAPKDIHPIDRVPDAAYTTPLPVAKEPESIELARETMASPEPDLSPESKKQRKLHKEMAKGGSTGGFRKLFGRSKNRQSKLPENAAEQLRSIAVADFKTPAHIPIQAHPAVPEKSAKQREDAMIAAPREEDPFKPEPVPVHEAAPAPIHAPEPEPAYEPSVPDEVSRVSTADARQAEEEFARFNQGPLLDQPAFIPDADTDDEAVPPPIARHASRSPLPSPQSDEGPTKPAPTPAPAPAPVVAKVDPQDRWAQIRKNAAERAAQRAQSGQADEKGSGGLVKTVSAEGDDDTSGEETIESRVARIKARVAVLTGNTEGTGGPGSPSPVVRR
ncbi:hypothetical protein B0H63DRAFT_387495 [Podospora didyma]|uniref:Meiotically up-regulated protein Msb1/Mug8 domain-containing protein n=1 Tax=Podospora didyma TaxID=330526 RepID=A0AAE0P6L7_9PEZI|nr:hypothetical protein B0H63DRAFT_387495 [Podospora didyma]